MTILTIHEKKEDDAYSIAASQLCFAVQESIDKKGSCALGIVGGRSIPPILERIASNKDWLPKEGIIDVFWLDERVSGEKNYPDAIDVMQKLNCAQCKIIPHPMRSTQSAEILREAKEISSKMQGFDVIIVSSGEDGHIASLFPHSDLLESDEQGYILIEDSPKPPSQRISASPDMIRKTNEAILLFIGDKKHAYELFNDPNMTFKDCPSKIVLDIKKSTVITAIK